MSSCADLSDNKLHCLQKEDNQPTIDDINKATAGLPVMNSQLNHLESAVTTDVCMIFLILNQLAVHPLSPYVVFQPCGS